MSDYRQRFYIQNRPVRGEVVQLEQSIQTIMAQRNYPLALQHLLAEMLVGAALLMGTFKVQGRLSIQAQGRHELKWAMAECDDAGQLRALGEWEEGAQWQQWQSSQDAFLALKGGVLFVNIEPLHGERYQGIVPLACDNLAACLEEYYQFSAQLPTKIQLATQHIKAGGMLLQLLPYSEEDKEHIDEDLWPRLAVLADTLVAQELTTLPAQELLYRLFHEEEQMMIAQPQPLQFGCTCSKARCEDALKQVGKQTVLDMLQSTDSIDMDCQFCNAQYRFNANQVLAIFNTRLYS